MVSTKLNALLFSTLALSLASGTAGDNTTVSTQCRLLQTSMSPSRLAVIGDCQTNNGDYVLTYIYAWHCMNYAEDEWKLRIGASDSPDGLANNCIRCEIVGKTGFACHCVMNDRNQYDWTNPFNIDDIFALDGIGNMKCR